MPRKSSRQTRKRVDGSEKSALKGAKRLGDIDPQERIEATLELRRRGGGSLAEALEARRRSGTEATVLSREEFRDTLGADPADVERVEAFAHAHGLDVVDANLAQRTVRVSGTAAAMRAAFGVKLGRFQFKTVRYRGRSGPVTVPAELAEIVTGVFGLDDRPQAHPHFRLMKARGRSASEITKTPPQVAALYGFPAGVDGSGQCIAMIELGGGYRLADLRKYFADLNVAVPTVSAISVLGGHNAPTGNPDGPDGEVMLDIEVAGSVAPGARIAVYFAPNTDDGFIGALKAAVHDDLRKPSVVSISWGAPEKDWTEQALRALDEACQEAGVLGVTVCVAAGDHGSSDESPPGRRNNADFPASSPNVLGCGGTRLQGQGRQITKEVVWNSNDGWATGGGVSEVFPLPSWQNSAGVPKAANPGGKVGRGVPDVAANADAETGYRIRVDGQDTVSGGTSAVAPLWAALVALINQHRKKPLGFLNPALYALKAGAFNDIRTGSNGAYSAKLGWDPCTGLGTPRGAELMNRLSAAATARG